MPRHKKPRCVSHMPNCTYFKPAGIPTCELEEVVLKLEEVEALRLKDLLGLDQSTCAAQMGVSRPTFQRIVIEARCKVAEVLVHGKSLRIEGGAYDFTQKQLTCPFCQYRFAKDKQTYCSDCDGSLNEPKT